MKLLLLAFGKPAFAMLGAVVFAVRPEYTIEDQLVAPPAELREFGIEQLDRREPDFKEDRPRFVPAAPAAPGGFPPPDSE